MSDVRPTVNQTVTNELSDLVVETFSKVSGHYLDRGTSLLETLAGLDAERVSRPAPGNGETVAAHVFHLCFYLEVLDEYATGRRTGKTDWTQSWVVSTDEAAWAALLARLAEGERRLLSSCQSWDWANEEHFGGLVSMVVHSAFHLGALRQILDATA